MSLIEENIKTGFTTGSTHPKNFDIINCEEINFKQFINDIIKYLPYYVLSFLFLRTFHKNEFLFCYLIIFGILINNIIKILKQEAAISIIIVSIYFLPSEKSELFTILLFYLSAIFQVFRLSGNRLYLKLRKIRIWGGPIYGCLLFWRVVNNYGVTQVDTVALILFLIGVKFRPNYFEGNYDENRRIHKLLMIVNFMILLIEDINRMIIVLK